MLKKSRGKNLIIKYHFNLHCDRLRVAVCRGRASRTVTSPVTVPCLDQNDMVMVAQRHTLTIDLTLTEVMAREINKRCNFPFYHTQICKLAIHKPCVLSMSWDIKLVSWYGYGILQDAQPRCANSSCYPSYQRVLHANKAKGSFLLCIDPFASFQYAFLNKRIFNCRLQRLLGKCHCMRLHFHD